MPLWNWTEMWSLSAGINRGLAAGWLVLLALAARPLLRRGPKWAPMALWAVVALRLLLPVSLESGWSLQPNAGLLPAESAAGQTAAQWTLVDNPLYPVDAVVMPGTQGGAPAWLGAVWLVGSGVLLLYAGAVYGRLAWRMRTAARLRENLFLSELTDVPFVLGLWKPKIYLPYGMEEGALKAVTAHERAHIRRGDPWWRLLGYLLLAAYWWNPLLWLAYGLFCRDMELACDARAVRGMDKATRADYAQVLLAYSAAPRRIPSGPLFFGEPGVKVRIRRILADKKPGLWLTGVAGLLCILAAVCFLTDPVVPQGDRLGCTAVDTRGGAYQAVFETRLGQDVTGGSIWAEQWQDGVCVASAPILFPKETEELSLRLDVRRESEGDPGVQVQLGTGFNGGSVLTWFPMAERAVGWSFTSYEIGEVVPVAPGETRVLAAMAFDIGSGVRSMSTEALEQEPWRLEEAPCIVVVRASFGAEALAGSQEETAKADA